MPSAAISSPGGASEASKSYTGALAIVTSLFFMWGFVTVLNDILVPHLKAIFDLSYAKVMLIQFAFFSAYFIFSIPSAKLIDWVGYKRTMVVGLMTRPETPFVSGSTLETVPSRLFATHTAPGVTATASGPAPTATV